MSTRSRSGNITITINNLSKGTLNLILNINGDDTVDVDHHSADSSHSVVVVKDGVNQQYSETKKPHRTTPDETRPTPACAKGETGNQQNAPNDTQSILLQNNRKRKQSRETDAVNFKHKYATGQKSDIKKDETEVVLNTKNQKEVLSVPPLLDPLDGTCEAKQIHENDSTEMDRIFMSMDFGKQVPTLAELIENGKLDRDYLYLQGNLSFKMPKIKYDKDKYLKPYFGWKFIGHGTKKRDGGFLKVYKYCLGVYKCKHCDYTESPRQPRIKIKFSAPMPPKRPCPQHPNDALVHHSCQCNLVVEDDETHWFVTHSGYHNHARPPPPGGKLKKKEISAVATSSECKTEPLDDDDDEKAEQKCLQPADSSVPVDQDDDDDDETDAEEPNNN